jgi:hypothetical protein
MNIQVRKATVSNIDEWRVYVDGEIVARCPKEDWAETIARQLMVLPNQEDEFEEKEFNFTFETEVDYEKAKSSGYITTFDVVRIKIKDIVAERTIDYPVHTREQYSKELRKLTFLPQIQVLDIYQDKLYYDIQEND